MTNTTPRNTGIADFREYPRVPLTMHGNFMIEGGCTDDCVLMDVSPGGGLFMSSTIPACGSIVSIQIDGLGALRGHVVRTGDMEFAVQFTACRNERERLAVAIAWQFNRGRLQLADRQPNQPPSEHQHDLVHLEDGGVLDACIVDVSLSGVAYICTTRPEVGTRVRVGTLSGQIVRVLETGFAVAFDPPGSEFGAAA